MAVPRFKPKSPVMLVFPVSAAVPVNGHPPEPDPEPRETICPFCLKRNLFVVWLYHIVPFVVIRVESKPDGLRNVTVLKLGFVCAKQVIEMIDNRNKSILCFISSLFNYPRSRICYGSANINKHGPTV